MAAYRCRFQNDYPQRVQIKLVGKEHQFTWQLDTSEVVFAENNTAIFEGPRVVIAWNDITGERLDFRPIDIFQEWSFVMQSNGLFAIGSL